MADKSLFQPKIVLIYNMARLGLMHAKRNCNFCHCRMSLTYQPRQGLVVPYKDGIPSDYHFEYVWQCNFCFRTTNLNKYNMLANINLSSLDWTARMMERGIFRSCRPATRFTG